MRAFAALATAIVSLTLSAQTTPIWQLQPSGTTAGLRGIDSVDGSVAWASGSNGTILRTTDGGAHWTRCATPDANKDGATLDFRGIQAWDANTAIVMASGPGAKSRLYKTTDACGKWKLILKNHDKTGFWDAIYRQGLDTVWLLGDPVKGMFVLYRGDGGANWTRQVNRNLRADPQKQGVFAASNSSLLVSGRFVVFASGGTGGAKVFSISNWAACFDDCPPEDENSDGHLNKWTVAQVPVGQSTASSGIFSIGLGKRTPPPSWAPLILIAVGGDYAKPNLSTGTAAYSLDGGLHWHASTTPPHGFRSAVQYSADLHAWITVGTNGSDISRDDGRTWRPLDNGNWNALSLPFVVGPNGRIAKLNASAIPSP